MAKRYSPHVYTNHHPNASLCLKRDGPAGRAIGSMIPTSKCIVEGEYQGRVGLLGQATRDAGRAKTVADCYARCLAHASCGFFTLQSSLRRHGQQRDAEYWEAEAVDSKCVLKSSWGAGPLGPCSSGSRCFSGSVRYSHPSDVVEQLQHTADRLDQADLQRRATESSARSRTVRASNASDALAHGGAERLHLVVTHFRSELPWLTPVLANHAHLRATVYDCGAWILPSSISSHPRVHVVDKSGVLEQATHFFGFFDFVIKRYDNLPTHTLFVHEHDIAFHRMTPIARTVHLADRAIRAARPTGGLAFANLGDALFVEWLSSWGSCQPVRSRGLTYLWQSLRDVLGEDGTSPPLALLDLAGAEGLVHQCRLRRRPLETWMRLRRLTLNETHRGTISFALETSFHRVMGEEWGRSFIAEHAPALRMAAGKQCFSMLESTHGARSWLRSLNASLSGHLEPGAIRTLQDSFQDLELHKLSANKVSPRDHDRAYFIQNQILVSAVAVIRNGSSELELRASNAAEPFQC